MPLIGLVFFRAAGLRLALPMSVVERVLPVPALEPAPGAPPFIEGFFDYRGRAIGVLRLDRLLDRPADELGLYAPLILLAGRAPPTALHVAGTDGVFTVGYDAIQPIADDETLEGCVSGRLGHDGDTIYLIHPEGLLLSAERARLAAFTAIRQARLDALAEASHAA
jgi:purine-binding chemotaxis protein CheW